MDDTGTYEVIVSSPCTSESYPPVDHARGHADGRTVRFIETQPQDQTVLVDEAASFSVAHPLEEPDVPVAQGRPTHRRGRIVHLFKSRRSRWRTRACMTCWWRGVVRSPVTLPR